ncbi:MAG: hypothetical protein HY526_02020 [Betaproteobacteria bacterium]|nr:hypothetical protein [Betaproteobacteria bacterium]
MKRRYNVRLNHITILDMSLMELDPDSAGGEFAIKRRPGSETGHDSTAVKRALIRRMATENALWGEERIADELEPGTRRLAAINIHNGIIVDWPVSLW